MMIARRAVLPLRFCLVLLFAVLFMLQTYVLPTEFAWMAQESAEDAYLRWPLTAVSVFWVLCIQMVVLCTWRLLSLVKDDRIFSAVALRWVDLILGAIGAAWVGQLGAFGYVGFTATDPGLFVLLFLLLVCGSAIGLLMVVMRALLRQATTLRTDLEAVI